MFARSAGNIGAPMEIVVLYHSYWVSNKDL
jgi:hypothetical protein